MPTIAANMRHQLKLSDLTAQIKDAIYQQFGDDSHWVSATIMDVKNYEGNRRCYLKLEEYHGGVKTAEAKAVFWSNYYDEIEKFEHLTKQTFKSGIEIICRVKVRYHAVYGLNLDVVEIDVAHTVGQLELKREATLQKLVADNPAIQVFDGIYRTHNNRLPLPRVIKNIALITAPNSDGQQDFQKEIRSNKHNYTYNITEYLTTIQGENAHRLILEQLTLIERSNIAYDAVAIIRGGGSTTDFLPFEEYELARRVALFPIPVFTGIGHDRNQSIVDLMAREYKTPTKVACYFVDHNFDFENDVIRLKDRMREAVKYELQSATDALNNARRIVKLASPEAILKRGFAILMADDKIVTDPAQLQPGQEIKTILRSEVIHSTITKIEKDENALKL